ncbi:nuclear transport factor 2 family protein [Cellvibrio mixtus]|uniref:nuclear transport factor 2 family protein n=1 Tax=Cellvibrio mixtus TaxID=39650 RepID=UPI0005869F02|nr:nuclear transport factor 2 family protein [Cellvibrio mixtus]
MKKIALMTLLFTVGFPAYADSCLDKEKLIALDQHYETAIQQADVKFLGKLLADEFYWVHNLASLKENKTQLLTRIQKEEKPKARRSHDLSVRQLQNTAVVEGLSSVEKWNVDGKTFRTSRYQVTRTYVDVNGECRLLAIQSMKVWSSDGK